MQFGAKKNMSEKERNMSAEEWVNYILRGLERKEERRSKKEETLTGIIFTDLPIGGRVIA